MYLNNAFTPIQKQKNDIISFVYLLLGSYGLLDAMLRYVLQHIL